MSVLTSQGTAIEFGGVSLGKIVGVNGSFSTGAKEIRELAPNVDEATGQYLSIYEQTMCEQTVELEAIASSFDTSRVGTTGALSVSNVGWSMSFGVAFLESMKVTAKVGDLLRLNYAFKRTYY